MLPPAEVHCPCSERGGETDKPTTPFSLAESLTSVVEKEVKDAIPQTFFSFSQKAQRKPTQKKKQPIQTKPKPGLLPSKKPSPSSTESDLHIAEMKYRINYLM